MEREDTRVTLVLNFDLGTGGVRAGVYDVEGRVMLSLSEASYDTTYPPAGWGRLELEAERSKGFWRRLFGG